MADLNVKDMDEATRRRLAERNPGLADELNPPPAIPDAPPTPPPTPARRPAAAAKKKPRRRGAPGPLRAVTGAAGTFTRDVAGPGPSFGQLVLYAAGATAAVVIAAQLVSPGGSRAVATVADTITAGFRKLADPLDPLIPAAQ